MDPLNIIARLSGTATGPAPTVEELTAAAADLRDALDAATKAETPDLQLAKDLREALDTVTGEITAREEQAAKTREEALALREGIFEDKADEDESDEDEETTETAEVETEKVAEPVAASTSIIDRLKAHAAKVPAAPQPEIPRGSQVTLKSVGPASGFNLGDAGEDLGGLGSLFATHAKSVMSSGNGQPLARLSRTFEDSRRLGSNVDLNNRKLSEVFGLGRAKPVAAAGGLCGPGDVDHTHPICSERGRPVRDSLPQFNASRGTVTYAPAAGVGDLDGAVSIWTAETDADPDGATKPCPPVECPEELSASVDAVVRCITVGNFQAQFSPEFWASRLDLLLVEFDRVAEQKAIQEIHLASTSLGSIDEGNTLNSFLAAVNNIVSSDRSANRNMDRRYKVLADAYLRDQIRNQVVKNLGVANNVEALQIADAQIAGWLADVGVDPVWTLDGTYTPDGGGSHRVLAPGAVPTVAGLYVYPEDAFLFLDGGTLDLGTQITDSSLNATNDRQAFAESFEKVAFRGCSSYAATIPIESVCGCAGSL